MDSATRLDSALFQLTPTRTRFDLVLFCNGKTEKIASGLFEPFISHLQLARDQISRGGYSISLQPPTRHAPWFTKATFERFVRFVSTPAVLERFVSIEREISQIGHSVQTTELSNANGVGQLEEGNKTAASGNLRKSIDSSKIRTELEKSNDDFPQENSKIQLHRLLETRKALLRREQAMAYARGIVAGFEMDSIDDLIFFADAFGALRLREACSKFKELCKKKHGDGLWMQELAAVEACSPAELSLPGTSGILLANEISGSNQQIMLNFAKSASSLTPAESKPDSTVSKESSDCKRDDNLPASDQVPSNNRNGQVPMPWLNHMPPYIYNFQGPIQQLPQFQGYPFPPMQPVPLQYQRYMQGPPGVNEPSRGQTNYHRNHKSSSKQKDKLLHKKGLESSEEDGSVESSDSGSGGDSDSSLQEEERKHSSRDHRYRRKHRNKSSRTVVIRNINYITPKKKNEEKSQVPGGISDEDELIDGISLKEEIDDAVGSFTKSDQLNAAEPDFHNHIVAVRSAAGKSNGDWDAFQNLLMRDEEVTVAGVERSNHVDVQDEDFTIRSSESAISATSHTLDLESEEPPRRGTVLADSFVVSERDRENEVRTKFDALADGENFRPLIKRRDCTDETLLFPHRVEEPGTKFEVIQSSSTGETSNFSTVRGEDWFIVNHNGKLENHDADDKPKVFNGDSIQLLEGDHSQKEQSMKLVLVDDSFMIQARPVGDDLYESQWKPDISMVADVSLASHLENGSADLQKDKPDSVVSEPNDLCMILERDCAFESAKDSWNIDYGLELSLVEANRRCSGVESNNTDEKLTANGESNSVKDDEVQVKRDPSKGTRSKSLNGSALKTKSPTQLRSKKPSPGTRTVVQKSKLEKEEEMRKKMEELLIQRQKRIAERTAASGLSVATPKKVQGESKTAKGSINRDRNKVHSIPQGTSRVNSVRVRAS